MQIEYANEKVEKQCESYQAAKKLFGGNEVLARSLLARINEINAAETLKDIVVQPKFRFHNLENKYGKDLSGYCAMDVKTRKEAWRIILRPLDEDGKPYDCFRIDQLAGKIEIVEVKEVSQHYE